MSGDNNKMVLDMQKSKEGQKSIWSLLEYCKNGKVYIEKWNTYNKFLRRLYKNEKE